MPEAHKPRYALVVLRYMRVVQGIENAVSTGELRPGDKLPAEKDLAEEYGVSYSTVRRAMIELRKRGVVESVWGIGTFIVERSDG